MYKLLLLLLLPLQLFGFDLKEQITKAEPGDYIVYSYKNNLVLLRIRENSKTTLVVEEISSPNAPDSSWQSWLEKQAPGHTSWTISRINIASGKVESIFSVDAREFQNTNPAFLFLPTLLQLKLNAVDTHDRKFVGAQPLAGEQDFRRLWLPKVIFEGKVSAAPIAVYRVNWPDDDSELSRKPIDLYFAQNLALPFLPYWIEVIGALGKAKISALDSGKGLTSPIQMGSYEQPELHGQ